MEILIIAILLVILIIAALRAFAAVIGALMVSLVVVAIAIAGTYLSLYLISILSIWYLRTNSNLAEVVSVELVGDNLSWFIDEQLIRTFAKRPVIIGFGAGVGIMCVSGMIMIMQYGALFEGFDHQARDTLSIPAPLAELATFVLSMMAFVLFFIFRVRKIEVIFEDWMVKRAESLMTRVETHVKGLKGLHTLESQIHSLAGDIGVNFPICVDHDLHNYACRHKMEILADPEVLTACISERSRRAQGDLSHLHKAEEVYAKAFEVYDEVVHEVAKAGSIPLIRELEQIYAGLTSADLKSLIPERKWGDFAEVVNAIIGELNHLSGLTIKYRKEGSRDAVPEQESLTEEQRAYGILGVPASASCEQIKRVYQSLAQLWHPDKGMVRDDRRMKEINWAYEFLRELRQF